MNEKKKTRLDKLLVDCGLVKSCERARGLILAGKVFVQGQRIDKVGSTVLPGMEILIKGEDLPYVSRGGVKLEKALEAFKTDVKGMVAMDVGASTGGFTDCLLKKGAKKVYAIDVGYGQLDWKLRTDKRVVVLEKRNIRYLKKEEIPEEIDLAVIDVSFISLTKVIPKVLEFLKDQGAIIALIKPQFEVNKGEVGKGGIVRNTEKHRKVILKMSEFADTINLSAKGITQSPILGQKGNREFLIYLLKSQVRTGKEEILNKIDALFNDLNSK